MAYMENQDAARFWFNKYLKVSEGGIRSKKHAAWPPFSLFFFLLLKIVVYDLAMN